MRFVFKSNLQSEEYINQDMVKQDIYFVVNDLNLNPSIDRVSVLVERRRQQILTKVCFHGEYNFKVVAASEDSLESLNKALDHIENKLKKMVKTRKNYLTTVSASGRRPAISRAYDRVSNG